MEEIKLFCPHCKKQIEAIDVTSEEKEIQGKLYKYYVRVYKGKCPVCGGKCWVCRKIKKNDV